MKKLTKKYKINASLKDVYDALTNPRIISKWSGTPAEFEAKPGGTFSMWENDIHGINKSLSTEKIIQDWKVDSWHAYSLVTFNLEEKNSITYIELIHEKIPDDAFEGIDTGWDEYYLTPLKNLLEQK